MNYSEAEINQMIFSNAGVNEMRGPLDVFTLEQLREIFNSEEYNYYSNYMKDWLWNAFEVAAFQEV